MEKAQREGHIRPSLTGADVLDEIRHMLHLRTPVYEQTASHVVDTSAFNIEEVAASIMEALPEGWQ